ncbi:hypothetical protein [Nostoc sp. LPT]|nr:hypothetical protein [Nostoc sp. LPT]
MLDIIHSLIACLASVILSINAQADYQQAWLDQNPFPVVDRDDK